ETADELGCKKIALGHHKDDIAETILMNMIWAGEISGINPVQMLFGGKITIVRPLVLLEEKEIRDYAEKAALPEIKSECPMNRNSKRAVVRDIITQLSKEDQDIKSNIIRAPLRIKTEYISDIEE
ncbi:MAG: ATP-binding protein, partial [Candidatus Omnitrophica bacterium]|nr:ATP-binding protein [Candidatus Omnitrophota bacterium]